MPFNIALELVVNEIRQLAAEGSAPAELARKELVAHTTLSELNLDSLGRLSLLAAIEDRVDAVLSESDMHDLRTLGDLARVVTEIGVATI